MSGMRFEVFGTYFAFFPRRSSHHSAIENWTQVFMKKNVALKIYMEKFKFIKFVFGKKSFEILKVPLKFIKIANVLENPLYF